MQPLQFLFIYFLTTLVKRLDLGSIKTVFAEYLLIHMKNAYICLCVHMRFPRFSHGSFAGARSPVDEVCRHIETLPAIGA